MNRIECESARRVGVSAALSCAMVLMAASAAAQQDGAAAQGATGAPLNDVDSVPRMADGRPDLSGVWWGGGDVGGPGFRPGGGAAGGERPATFTDLYQPWAKEHAATLTDADDPTLRCVSTAFGTLNVRFWDVGAVGQIVATPDFVVLLTETFHGYQLVPTDGRPHRDTVPPSRRGEAVGHWDGDTFVIEVDNFTDDTWIWAEGRVSFHSDALRVVERYQRVDADTLVIDAIVYDDKVLTEPWVVPTQTLQLAPFDHIMPLDCLGTETFDLVDGVGQ